MKKLVICLFTFIIVIIFSSIKANTGIYIYSCREDLLDTFEYLYQDGVKSNYSFKYDTETPITLEAEILENDKLYYSYKNEPVIYSGQGTLYISFFDQRLVIKSFPVKNLNNYPPNTKNNAEEEIMKSLAQNITYQRNDKASLVNKKTLLMSGKTKVNENEYILNIYVYPTKQSK